jgi:hypothetical protein
MFEQMLKSYFKKMFEVGKTGDAREESYYSALEDLLQTYGDSIRSALGSGINNQLSTQGKLGGLQLLFITGSNLMT